MTAFVAPYGREPRALPFTTRWLLSRFPVMDARLSFARTLHHRLNPMNFENGPIESALRKPCLRNYNHEKRLLEIIVKESASFLNSTIILGGITTLCACYHYRFRVATTQKMIWPENNSLSIRNFS